MKSHPKSVLAGLALAALQQGCDSGASTASDGGASARPYVLGFRIETDDDGNTADYVLTASDISKGELSVEGKGVEQVGWRYMGALGKTLYSIGYYNDNNLVAYRLDGSGKLVEKDRVMFQTTIDVVGDADDTTLLAMEVPRKTITPRTWHVFDLEHVSIVKKVVDSIYVDYADSLLPWPTALVRRGDKAARPTCSRRRSSTRSIAISWWSSRGAANHGPSRNSCPSPRRRWAGTGRSVGSRRAPIPRRPGRSVRASRTTRRSPTSARWRTMSRCTSIHGQEMSWVSWTADWSSSSS